MHTRTVATALITAGLAISLLGCSNDEAATPAKPSATHSTKTDAKAGHLTAEKAAQQLAAATGVTTLGDPQDNTSGCASKATNGCTQLITTDTVSVYEFKTDAVSQHWVKTMKPNGDWRQVGRFALAWTARDQSLTSKERRGELVTALQKLTATE